MSGIAIIGAGGFAREVLWIIRECAARGGAVEPWGFVDDRAETHGQELCGLPIRGPIEMLASVKDQVQAVIAVGNPATKRKLVERVEAMGVKFATLVYPNVEKSDFVELGEGCIICVNSIFTTQIKIGRHVIINADCSMGHDSTIGDFTTVAHGVRISGNCHIGEMAEIGTGVIFIQGVSVGEGSVVGAGSVIIRDIPAHVTAVGVPAKVIKEHK